MNMHEMYEWKFGRVFSSNEFGFYFWEHVLVHFVYLKKKIAHLS